MSLDFKIDGIYDLEVYPSTILGSGFKGVKVITQLSAARAARESPQVEVQHDNFKALLPPGSPADWRDQIFVEFLLPSGSTAILGTSWIKPESVVQVVRMSAVVTIDGVSTTDLPVIREALAAAGYSPSKFETKQTS